MLSSFSASCHLFYECLCALSCPCGQPGPCSPGAARADPDECPMSRGRTRSCFATAPLPSAAQTTGSTGTHACVSILPRQGLLWEAGMLPAPAVSGASWMNLSRPRLGEAPEPPNLSHPAGQSCSPACPQHPVGTAGLCSLGSGSCGFSSLPVLPVQRGTGRGTVGLTDPVPCPGGLLATQLWGRAHSCDP